MPRGDMKDARLTVRVRSELRQFVEAFADELGITKADVVSLALEAVKSQSKLRSRIADKVQKWWTV